jgi:glycosyltransferase involved in cell wall biosynthesis
VKEFKYKILIGSLSEDESTPIHTITKSFLKSQCLKEEYQLIPFYKIRKYGKSKRARFNLLNLFYLFKHLINWCIKLFTYKPDIAHYPITSYWNLEKSLLFLKVAGFFGAKKIGHLHGGAFLDFWEEISELRRKTNLRELNNLDVLIVASNYWKKVLEEKCGIKTKIEIIPNPIDKSFEKEALNFRKPNGNFLLYMGRIDINKGILDLIESANLLKDRIKLKFVLAGRIEKKENLNICKNLIEKYNLESKVKIIGEVTEEEKIRLFGDASIFILPSYVENLPLVVIEAASASLPIIATPVGGLSDFFKHNQSIIFVTPGDINQIAEAIENLSKDYKKRERLGKAAREVFLKSFSRKRIMSSLSKVYKNILENNQ